MSIHSVLQIVAVAIILHVYRTDARFSIGSHLGESRLSAHATRMHEARARVPRQARRGPKELMKR